MDIPGFFKGLLHGTVWDGIIFDELHRVWIEMQVRELAVAEGLEGLGGLSFWAAHYASPELLRWFGELFRHYGIEGRRDRPVPADVRIKGADVRPAGAEEGDFREDSWSHMWRLSPPYQDVHWTMHYRVFKASGTEAHLEISDAEPGEFLWGFVKIQPYFTREMPKTAVSRKISAE